MMQVSVNGETMTVKPGSSLADLLAGLDLDPRKVAVERNLEIAPRSGYAQTALADGDRIEIVQFVGGG